jgi:DNA (cytosine-5)-methyltransferase 1
MELTHGSLFTGRGGFDAAAEDLGIKTIWNCEIDRFLRAKLKKLYPDTKQYSNIHYVKYPIGPSIISAGFPCQDISSANNNAIGISGKRSGLFMEVSRITAEVKPAYLLLENSPQLLNKGFEVVLSELSKIGYDAEWQCLSATNFGYPHRRERIYIIAYPFSERRSRPVFKPLSTYEIQRKWTPTEAYLRMSVERANSFRNIKHIQRGNVVPNFGREISAYGNAVMPVIATYLFQCIIDDYKLSGSCRS